MGKFIDLTGQRFGFWVVIKKLNKNKNGQIQWACKCECGVIKSVTSNSLRTGNSTSCGCNHSQNISGKKFDDLIILGPDYSSGRKLWLCKCNCGKTVLAPSYKLYNKIITSCGHDFIVKDNINYNTNVVL